MLLGFGLAGAAGNFTAGVTVRAHLRATLMGSGLLIAVSALLLATLTGARPLTIALVAVWGAGFGAVPVAAQSWMARAMPANLEGGLALFVSALQGSLAGSARWAVDAVFDAAGTGVLADAVALAGGPGRVITLSDPAAADFGVTLSEPTPGRAPGALDETIALLADGRLRLRAHTTMPMQQAAEAHRQLENGTVHQRIILTLN